MVDHIVKPLNASNASGIAFFVLGEIPTANDDAHIGWRWKEFFSFM